MVVAKNPLPSLCELLQISYFELLCSTKENATLSREVKCMRPKEVCLPVFIESVNVALGTVPKSIALFLDSGHQNQKGKTIYVHSCSAFNDF